MFDKLGWIIAGALAVLIIGYLLGKRSAGSTAETRSPQASGDVLVEPAPPIASKAPLGEPRQDPPPASAHDMPDRDRAAAVQTQPPRPGVAPPPAATAGGQRGGSFLPPRPAAAPPPASTAGPARTAVRPAAAAGPGLAGVSSWGYQLQELDLAAAAASPYDLIVIDHSRDGSEEGALTPAELEHLKRKPDGGRRHVIAYISIGEAESYRAYWLKSWKRSPPPWLLGENPEWRENYSVCFWDPAWQAIIFGSPHAYLDRIVAQGFDGVYLDKCDVTEDLKEHFPQAARSRPNLERDMIEFVRRMAAHARGLKPGFAFIMQNAEPLLAHADLRATIDGVGKEELYFGVDGGEDANDRDMVQESRMLLKRAQSEGKAILCVEYLSDRRKQRQASQMAAADGFVLFLSPVDRELASLGSGPVTT